MVTTVMHGNLNHVDCSHVEVTAVTMVLPNDRFETKENINLNQN